MTSNSGIAFAELMTCFWLYGSLSFQIWSLWCLLCFTIASLCKDPGDGYVHHTRTSLN